MKDSTAEELTQGAAVSDRLCICDPVQNIRCAMHYPSSSGSTERASEIPGVKNSGVFTTSASGMKRDANPQGAIDYSNILHGPMYDRWALHLTKAKVKYPDAAPGVPNWTLGANLEDYLRFRESAFRHLRKWMNGQRDEDHAAAVYFNLNGAEYVRNRLNPDERRKLNDLEERWAAFQEENHGAQ